MARGDITAGEVFKDRDMLNRLGYGIFDVSWGKDGVGFENVRDFSYVVAQDKDPKIYRHKVYEILGRYYNNQLAKAIWNEFINHKWVLSEQADHEVDLETAAHDWYDNYGHAFLKNWTFRNSDIPSRIRNRSEPRKSWLGQVAGYIIPQWRELLNAGFTVTDILLAKALTRTPEAKKLGQNWRSRVLSHVPSFPLRRPNGKHRAENGAKPADGEWRDDGPYLVIEKNHRDDIPGRRYVYLVARLTGHQITTSEEAEKRWREILEHKWYLSERAGKDVGLRTAALDYYRRLNLIQETEQGQES